MGRSIENSLRTANRLAHAWGVDLRRTRTALKWRGKVRRDAKNLWAQARASQGSRDFAKGSFYPIYSDLGASAGLGGHYLYQDLLVARDIYHRNPVRHIDIGSSVHGLVTAVASFREIEVVDVRPMELSLPGVTFHEVDVAQAGPSKLGTCDSVSSLHAVEHFGLGRYGDSVDWDGWKRGVEFMTRLLVDGGVLYLSVPSGADQRVEFNAHRVFSIPFLRDYLSQDYAIERLHFVTDSGRLVGDVDLESSEAKRTFDAHYGCSIWFLRKGHGD
jgi:hypothetical protein